MTAVSRPVAGGDPLVWAAPPGAVRALGWSGGQVVWLVGEAGSQLLVLADPQARELRTWVELDVGDAPVADVAWSSALSG